MEQQFDHASDARSLVDPSAGRTVQGEARRDRPARISEKAGSIWGFKDPRTARLLPLWLEIIDELGLDPRYILVTRHPTDVAKSLNAREGVSQMHAELLWIDHNIDALTYTRGKLNGIVEYRRWFDDPMEQATYLIERIGLERPG